MSLEWVVVAALVGWLFSTLALVVSNRQSNDREARKEYRAAVGSLESCVGRLLDAYRTYLTEPGAVKNEQARLQVHSEINRLRRLVESFSRAGGASLSDPFAQLFEVLTGGAFESRTRKPDTAAEDYASAVAEAENLLECAESWFRTTYIRSGFFRIR
jgi:uncharacterized membrane protein YccC